MELRKNPNNKHKTNQLYKPQHFSAITQQIQRHVIVVNKTITKGGPIIKRFTVLRKQFSLERGELTFAMQVC
jgi:long-subunit acyl-CoA synthetase (AMP-forming)